VVKIGNTWESKKSKKELTLSSISDVFSKKFGNLI